MNRLQVALRPDLLNAAPGGVCAVVDVIRASSTLIALAEAGDPTVWLAADIEAARRARDARPDALLCGEAGGIKPAGFDYGNSPRTVASAEFGGRDVIMVTTNGTGALRRWQTAGRVFVGALRNADAVAHRLLEAATDPPTDITVVCAGRDGELALEDVYTAGAIVRRLQRARPSLELAESAVMALHVNHAYATPLQALQASRGAKLLEPIGLSADVAFCAKEDTSIAVPELGGPGRLRLLDTA